MSNWKSCSRLFLIVAIALASGFARESNFVPGTEWPGRSWTADAFAHAPLSFEENLGQTDPDMKFLARSGALFFLTSTDVVLLMAKPDGQPARDAFRNHPNRQRRTLAALRMSFVGGTRALRMAGIRPASGKANFFIGNDPTKWRSDVPTYTRVCRPEIYPGIGVIYHGNQRQLEYDFVVSPGTDPRRILMRFEGEERLEVDTAGELFMDTAAGAVRLQRPVV